jgi:hypothetical protein
MYHDDVTCWTAGRLSLCTGGVSLPGLLLYVSGVLDGFHRSVTSVRLPLESGHNNSIGIGFTSMAPVFCEVLQSSMFWSWVLKRWIFGSSFGHHQVTCVCNHDMALKYFCRYRLLCSLLSTGQISRVSIGYHLSMLAFVPHQHT